MAEKRDGKFVLNYLKENWKKVAVIAAATKAVLGVLLYVTMTMNNYVGAVDGLRSEIKNVKSQKTSESGDFKVLQSQNKDLKEDMKEIKGELKEMRRFMREHYNYTIKIDTFLGKKFRGK